MIRIPYSANNFPASSSALLRGRHDLLVSWADLVWAAITVGKQKVDHLFLHGHHSLSDIIVRTHMLYANLVQKGSFLRKSILFDNLDGTEKGATSYFFGMLLTKLAGEKLLDTPWLFHLSSFVANGGTVVLIKKSQPDLIGINKRRDWVVAEAKGRSYSFNQDAIDKAKLQTRQVRQINGQYPCLRVGVQSFFSPNLSLYLQDPDDSDAHAEDMEVNLGDLVSDYYSLVYRATKSSNKPKLFHHNKYAFSSLGIPGISVGLDLRIQAALESGRPLEIIDLLTREQRLPKKENEDGFYFFSDGLALRLGSRWSKDSMKMNPLDRP